MEVEIQFYILVPLVCLLFKLEKTIRRLVLFLIIFIFIFLNFYFDINFRTIIAQAHYFFIGMFLSDLYISKDLVKIKYPIIGFIGLLIIFFIDRELNNTFEFIFILGCIFLFYSVLSNRFWKQIFAFKPISIIGGMCYSIYLLHYPIISFFANFLSKFYKPSNQSDIFVFILILIPIILVVSSIFFIDRKTLYG